MKKEQRKVELYQAKNGDIELQWRQALPLELLIVLKVAVGGRLRGHRPLLRNGKMTLLDYKVLIRPIGRHEGVAV